MHGPCAKKKTYQIHGEKDLFEKGSGLMGVNEEVKIKRSGKY